MDKLKNIVAYTEYQAELQNAAIAAGFIFNVLGKVDGEPILMLNKNTQKGTVDKQRILVAAGFHGNEIGGPWGVVDWIKKFGSQQFDNVVVTILPLVNPNGFIRGTREDSLIDDPNRGWTKDPEKYASKEGVVLLSHIQELYDASVDGFLTLHENAADKYFVISIDEQGILTDKLTAAGGMFFDTEHKEKPLDDTFEALLYKLGTPTVVVSEAPNKQPLDSRIECNAYIIQQFIEYYEYMEWNK